MEHNTSTTITEYESGTVRPQEGLNNSPGQNTIYASVTESILDSLKNGVIPWKKPWCSGLPRNLVTNKFYRGVNVFLLGSRPYTSPYWLTFKQATDCGGHVKKGERSSIIVFWRWIKVVSAGASAANRSESLQEVDEIEAFPILRFHRVFNIEQTEGIQDPSRNRPFESAAEADKVVRAMPCPPPVLHGGDRAYYSVEKDVIGMPPPARFEESSAYYSTLFHELVHSTGHSSRLNRFTNKSRGWFDLDGYSKEELIAEMGASFLCAHTGIVSHAQIENTAAYISSWLKVLGSDSRFVVSAAARAQRAVDYILGSQPVRGGVNHN